MDGVKERSTANPSTRQTNLFRRLAVVVLLFGALLAVLLSGKPTVPTHAGNDATFWLLQVYGSANPSLARMEWTRRRLSGTSGAAATQRQAIDAFREMGPDGIEFLVGALGHEAGIWSRIKQSCHPRLPSWARRRIAPPIDAETFSNAALLVLLNVPNTRPKETFPKLVSLATSDEPYVRNHAWAILSHYARQYDDLDITPFEARLRPALNDTNYWIRVNATKTLLHAGLAGPEVIPLLKPVVTNGDSTLARAALNLIYQLETEPYHNR